VYRSGNNATGQTVIRRGWFSDRLKIVSLSIAARKGGGAHRLRNPPVDAGPVGERKRRRRLLASLSLNALPSADSAAQSRKLGSPGNRQ
jgi:hypothetical protein